MFPIGDTNVRGRGFPFVNYAIIIINAIVFFYELSLSQPALDNFFNHYAVIPTQILNGQNWASLLTSMWLHGGWMHIIGNMLFLWVFGDNIEQVVGHIPYIIFYLLGGIIASFAHVFMNPASDLPSLGASGAIAAVLGAYIVMFPRSQVRVLYFIGFFGGIGRVSAILFLGIWIVTQLFNGVASLGVPS